MKKTIAVFLGFVIAFSINAQVQCKVYTDCDHNYSTRRPILNWEANITVDECDDFNNPNDFVPAFIATSEGGSWMYLKNGLYKISYSEGQSNNVESYWVCDTLDGVEHCWHEDQIYTWVSRVKDFSSGLETTVVYPQKDGKSSTSAVFSIDARSSLKAFQIYGNTNPLWETSPGVWGRMTVAGYMTIEKVKE